MSEQGIIFIFGIAVAGASYFVKNFILDQIIVYRRTVGKIKNRVRYHSNIITNDAFPRQIVRPIYEELRKLSCDLDENYYSVPFAKNLHGLYFMPSQESIDSAAIQLIFLSNNTGKHGSVEKNYDSIREIEKLLNIKIISS